MKFGVREICDVTFKTTAAGQKIGKKVFANAGMPAFMIDTAKTSSLEQATTTVYANGGKGNVRLMSWEGEKTMTFTVEDALISPMGLAVLSGAGLFDANIDEPMHVHITLDTSTDANGKATVKLEDLQRETGLNTATSFKVCNKTDIPAYATVLDGSGAGIDFCDNVTIVNTSGETIETTEVTVDASNNVIYLIKKENTAVANKAVKIDFYVIMTRGVQEIQIKPEDFGGYFYVEAQTLFRREDTGLDMPAEIILPKVKVQSGFTFSMASSGDPSTFTFTMDALPGYTKFDPTTKVMCVMQVIGTDNDAEDAVTAHSHSMDSDTPDFGLNIVNVSLIEEGANKNKVKVVLNGDSNNTATVFASPSLGTFTYTASTGYVSANAAAAGKYTITATKGQLSDKFIFTAVPIE